jgi:uncharacterized protein YqjF (DUF2071 family)
MRQLENAKDMQYRQWIAPAQRAVMGQVWSELLFAHWPVSYEALRSKIPTGLELDTFEGQAWVGVVPFLMSDVRLFGMPAMPYLSSFAELNVRTYVTVDNKPGVYFFSLDASNPVAVTTARNWYHLPYYNAKMQVDVTASKIRYLSQRTHRLAPAGNLEAIYGPTGDVFQTTPGTLEHWLTARYCLYAADRHQNIYRGEINHAPWPLQTAQAKFIKNSVAQSWGIDLPQIEPLLHFSRRLEVVAWPIHRIS